MKEKITIGTFLAEFLKAFDKLLNNIGRISEGFIMQTLYIFGTASFVFFFGGMNPSIFIIFIILYMGFLKRWRDRRTKVISIKEV